MSEELQKLLKKALNNNTYDYDAMHNTLKEAWMNSYSYLYAMQKAYVEYEELFYFSNDEISRNSKLIGELYLDKMIYANFDIDYDLIHVYTREEFRLSKYYRNSFSITDMVNHPEIFTKIPVVIIDDQVIWDYKITVKKDCTTFTLPFRRNFVLEDKRNPITDEVIYIDHKVQVLVIDNIFYHRYTFNKNMALFSPVNKTIKFTEDTLKTMCESDIKLEVISEYITEKGYNSQSQITPSDQISINKRTSHRLDLLKIPKQDGIMMCSIHFPNSRGRGYELGTTLIPLIKDTDGYYVGELTDDLVVSITNCNTNFLMSTVFFNRLYQHTFYTGKNKTVATTAGADLMVVEKESLVPYKTPIPVEDFMIFKKSNDKSGFILEKNTEMLEMHYPNIYRLKDDTLSDGDTYRVFYFYYNAYDLEYTVIFDYYFQFLVDTFRDQSMEKIINDIYYKRSDLSQYSDDQIKSFYDTFSHIMNYEYLKYQYGESDFLHRYLKIEGNENNEPIQYKDETLKKWIRDDQWILRDYVLEQNKLGASYHLFTKTLDLDGRLRTNTEPEFGSPAKEFDEERYVFSFNNEKDYPVLLDCRVFVDGILIGDVYQERRLFMDYFYIPTSFVTNDSYIELEIFPSYSFSKEMTFTSLNDEEHVTLVEPEDDIFPTLADVYYEDNYQDDRDDPIKRYDPSFFDITAKYSRGEFNVESDDPEKEPIKFTRLKTFTVKPNSEDVLNIPFKLKISKCSNMIRFMMDREGYAYITLVESKFCFNMDYIRVYRNGRLIPRSYYRLLTTFNCPRLLFLEWFNIGDIIYIDITPYRYHELYYNEELQKGETTIDLRNIITKPFDIRYYDVYMNGRKLSLNNVITVSPWELTLVNLKSNYNLLIYERDRDWEYFGLDYTENIYYFSMDDLFNSNFVSEDEKNKLIKDIIDTKKDSHLTIYPNTNDEEKMDFECRESEYAFFQVFYFDELIAKTFVNPDVKQFNREVMLEVFIEIYDRYRKSSSEESEDETDKQRRLEYPDIIFLDPDNMVEGETEDCDSYIFEVGHSDEVSQELLDQPIHIPPEGNI